MGVRIRGGSRGDQAAIIGGRQAGTAGRPMPNGCAAKAFAAVDRKKWGKTMAWRGVFNFNTLSQESTDKLPAINDHKE